MKEKSGLHILSWIHHSVSYLILSWIHHSVSYLILSWIHHSVSYLILSWIHHSVSYLIIGIRPGCSSISIHMMFHNYLDYVIIVISLLLRDSVSLTRHDDGIRHERTRTDRVKTKHASKTETQKPNIVIVMTDDQDEVLGKIGFYTLLYTDTSK